MKIIQANKKADENINQAKVFHDVFISYSRRDKDFVRKLHGGLEALNREAWVDWTDIPPTAKWLAEIFEGIEAAGTFICVLSPDYLASSVCAREVEHAIKYKKRLIPIVCRDVNPDEVNPELATLNWIFFRTSDNFDDALKKLIEALDTNLDYIHMSSRLLVRAREWENNGYNSSFTLRGNDLEKAERWRDKATATDKKPSPSELQLRYITSSRRVATTRQRIALGAVSLGLMVTLLLSFLSYTLYQGQRKATQQALDNLATAVSRQLATEADLQASSNPQLAALLSIAAFKTRNTPEARTSLMHQLDRVQHIDRFLSANSGPINSVAFSPDGRTLASGSNNVTLWDAAKGASLVTLPGAALRVAFSPDGKMLAVAGEKKSILWDVARHTQLATFPGNNGYIAFSPDGHTLAFYTFAYTSGLADKLIFWDVVKHTQIASIPAQSGVGGPIAFSPNGTMLASEGGLGGDIVLWNIAQRSKIADLQGGHTRGIWSLAFSPDGKFLASGGHDAKLVLWDVIQHRQLVNFDATGDVYDLAFSPDGHTLATADGGKNVILWDVVDYKRLTTLPGHTDQVNSLAFSPDGSRLASGSNDTNIIIWNLAGKNKLFLGSLPIHNNTTSSLAFNLDGRILADGEIDKVALWDVARRTQLVTLPGAARLVAFSPDGHTLATADGGNEVILWDVVGYKRLTTLTGHTDKITSLAFSPDGRILASASWDSHVILWDMKGYERLATLTPVRDGGVNSLAFSPDGKVLASSGFGDIVFWDVAHSTKLFTIPSTTPAGVVLSIAFSPDGHTFAATAQEGAFTALGCAGCKVIVWDLTRHIEIAELSGHVYEPTSVTFNQDGQILASAAGDKAILWSVGQGAIMTSFGDGADLAIFSPDGNLLATNFENPQDSGTSYVDLWNVNITSWLQILCNVAGRNLTQREWTSYLPPDRPYEPICRS